MEDKHRPYGPYEKYIKRPLDCFLATCALIVLSPVMGITALLVKTKLGSPVLFKQNRPGRIEFSTGKEKIFRLCKFRSMSNEKNEKGELLPDELRLTKFGQMLRSTSLDELPELINIIKGDMAIVGPRPLAMQYLPYYNKEERKRHFVRPGLTGLAQVNGRNSTNWPQRFKYDVDYVNSISFKTDVLIMLKTIYKVFRRKDVAVRGVGKVMDFDKYRQLEDKLTTQYGNDHYIKLRWIEKKDAQILMELNNNEEIANCVVGNPKKVSYNEQLVWMAKITEEKNTVRMMIEYDRTVVGTLIISNIDFNNKTGNINIKILPKYHGKKIGTNALNMACQYAFEDLGLCCLTAHILPDNTASISLFTKAGFCKEGILRSRVIKADHRKDLISMSYLKCDDERRD